MKSLLSLLAYYLIIILLLAVTVHQDWKRETLFMLCLGVLNGLRDSATRKGWI